MEISDSILTVQNLGGGDSCLVSSTPLITVCWRCSIFKRWQDKRTHISQQQQQQRRTRSLIASCFDTVDLHRWSVGVSRRRGYGQCHRGL